MIILMVIFVGIAAFLSGLAVGVKDVPPKNVKTKPVLDEDLISLKKEYENFLNYDGSVQQ